MTPSRWIEQAAALRERLARRRPGATATTDAVSAAQDDPPADPAPPTPKPPVHPADPAPAVARLQAGREDAVAQVMRAYRTVLGRPADDGALDHYVPSVQNGSLSLAEVCAELVHSPEFAIRLSPSSADIDARDALPDGAVDVARLLTTLTVDEVRQSFDDYYRTNLGSPDYYFAKPLTNSDEAPDLLTCFAQIVGTLRPLAGMRVLDFGAGTGWSTRFLSQLGCETVALDMSSAALDVARRQFERLPVVGDQPAPSFLLFDGRHIDLPDESIDQIVCFDALNHTLDPEAVLAEMGRVLRPGGSAGFAEPGPNHSKTPQSQLEMRTFTMIENDIVMADIRRWAEAAGFTDLKLALFSSQPYAVSVDEYEDFLGGGSAVASYAHHVRRFAEQRRIFFLTKGEPRPADSRDRRGLLADVEVRLARRDAPVGGSWTGSARVTNVGTNAWLPSTATVGGVQLGVHLSTDEGHLVERDYARIPLPVDDEPTTAPGRTLDVPFTVSAPDTPGRYRLGVDLVSERVCWFEANGSPTVELQVKVTG
jgi:ubiquinone/menaquinone biosynthesis C-methylase UbiE